MDLSSILPPSDLLDKLRGVETGLRQRKRLTGAGGLVSLVISAFYLLALVEKNIRSGAELVTRTFTDPGLLLPALILILSALFITWSTFWLRESRQPFRYTCSVGTFEPVTTDAPAAVQSWMTWIRHDIERLLNERVQRFFFAGQPKAVTPGTNTDHDALGEPYIHIHANWVVRAAKPGAVRPYEIEVMPRIRLAPATTAEVMAQQSTVFPLDLERLDRAAYDELLEQVYHSVVTEVYRQLEGDVGRKIRLLPTARYRAIALLYEADDYARSNSLHAYEEAEKLYREAAALADPQWGVPLHTFLPRLWRSLRCIVHGARFMLRRFDAFYHPSAEAMDLLGARAMTGCARMLVFKQLLRGIVGKAAGATFEAPSVAALAVERITALSRDVPGYASALFDAQVTLSLARWKMGDVREAAAAIDRAHTANPEKCEEDAMFILARALVAPDIRTRLALLRRSVERAPRFEVAQYWLAAESEMLWRSREPLETNMANSVIQEYEKLLKLNPANLSGCANAGYIRWLLEDQKDARKFFEQGMRFTSTRSDLFATELEYGLARIEAERGNLSAAYGHYVAAVSVLSLGFQGSDFRSYYFQPMGESIERRFRVYYMRVRKHVRAVSPTDHENYRISKSIHAFALNDLAESYVYLVGYPEYPHDARRRRLGIAALKRATRCNPKFLLPYGSLARLSPDQRLKYLEEGLKTEPAWPYGAKALAFYHANEILDLRPLTKVIHETHVAIAEKQNRIRTIRWWKAIPQGRAKAQYFDHKLKQERASLIKHQETLDLSEQRLSEMTLAGANHRRRTFALIRKILPHQWLWGKDGLNFDTLSNRMLQLERRWERELTQDNVDAFYAWVRCFLYVDEAEGHAIESLTHILKLYWPGDPYILSERVIAKQTQTLNNENLQKEIVDEALGSYPGAIVVLVERNVKVTNQQLIDSDQAALELGGYYREREGMKLRREEMYRTVADSRTDPAEGDELYRKAAEVFAGDWPRERLANRMRWRTAAENATSHLQEDMIAARIAAKREPRNSNYADRLAHLEWRLNRGIVEDTLLQTPERLVIELGEEVVAWSDVDAIYEEMALRFFPLRGFNLPYVMLRKPEGDARRFRILVNGSVVTDRYLDPADPVPELIRNNLEAVLQKHAVAFLRLDSVFWLLNSDGTRFGDAIRADGLLPEITRVLRGLAADGISLQHPQPIVHAFRAAYEPGRTLTEILERVRNHPDVRKRITRAHGSGKRVIMRTGPVFESIVRRGLEAGGGAVVALDTKTASALRKSVVDSFGAVENESRPVLVTTPELRPWVKQIVEGSVQRLAVLPEGQLSTDDAQGVRGTIDYSEPDPWVAP